MENSDSVSIWNERTFSPINIIKIFLSKDKNDSGKEGLLTIIKVWMSYASDISLVREPKAGAAITWPSSQYPVWTGVQGPGTISNTLTTVITVNSKLYFGSDLSVTSYASINEMDQLTCNLTNRVKSQIFHIF